MGSAENIESRTHSGKMILIVLFSNLIIFALCELGTKTNSKASGTQKTFSIKEEEIKRKTIMELNERNFDKVTSKGHTFVKFYAPWCGHCKQMEPDWKEVGEFLTRNPIENIDLTIGEINCVENSILCLKEAVDAYPTIRMYKPDNTAEEYMYARSANRMKRFLIEKLTDLDNLPTDSIGIFKLNDLTFDPFINKNQVVVIKFVTPGCDHCTSYKKIYDDVVIQFLMEESEDLKFAEIDCTDKDSLNVCLDEGVQSFPTTHTYKDGIIEDIFSDERTEKNLENFIWQTVDPSRVEEVNPFEALAGMAEPDCDCDEDEKDNDDYDDYDHNEDFEDYYDEDEEKKESQGMLNSEEISNNKDEL